MQSTEISQHFQNQANACRNMGSEFTATLCKNLITVLDTDTQTGMRIENWPGDPAADALALRLCGALHSIIITDPQDPLKEIYPPNFGDNSNFKEVLSAAIQRHDKTLCQWLDLPPQTNETGRAAALIPGLLEISRTSKLPIHLCEIGSSAGLNLALDSFYCTYNSTHWGNPNSPVNLTPELKGPAPDLSGNLEILSRIGCDISPIDVTDPTQQLRLRSYIWPDQKPRMDRVKGAISLALKNPPKLLKMDAADFVEAQLSHRPDNTAFVLMHSVVWQYLPHSTQQKIENSLRQHGENATRSNPIYWLRLEGLGGKEPAASLLLDRWPNHQHTKLASACFHGNWIDFTKN